MDRRQFMALVGASIAGGISGVFPLDSAPRDLPLAKIQGMQRLFEANATSPVLSFRAFLISDFVAFLVRAKAEGEARGEPLRRLYLPQGLYDAVFVGLVYGEECVSAAVLPESLPIKAGLVVLGVEVVPEASRMVAWVAVPK